MFVKFNIGLEAVDRNKIEFYYKPEMDKPYCYDLTKKALDLFN